MHDTPTDPGEIWSKLLSRRPEIIRHTFMQLSPEDQQAVLEHLERMASEDGWHEEQRFSALAAIEALRNVPHQ
jgi:hypothetical protein